MCTRGREGRRRRLRLGWSDCIKMEAKGAEWKTGTGGQCVVTVYRSQKKNDTSSVHSVATSMPSR